KIVFRAGCSVTISGINVTPVFSSGPQADPFETPLMLASENGEGRVVALGSYEMFRDKISGGMRQDDHKTLALNIFSWLKSTHREKIKAGLVNPTPQNDSFAEFSSNSSSSSNSNGIPSSYGSNLPPNGNSGAPPDFSGMIYPKTYESQVKILAKEDLLNAFEHTLTDFYTFKQRMLQEFEQFETNLALLMRAVLASEEDIIELKKLNTEKSPTGANPINDEAGYASNAAIQNGEEYNLPEDLNPEGSSTSSEPTPESIASDLKALQPPTPKKDAPKSKEELLEEKQNLENKMNSIKNLSEFVEKKFKSGKLEEAGYIKQTKKLDKDINKANLQLAEIQKSLDKF
ncbi:MAG: hypothetical protein ACTSYI_15670, partial [Promethearchaeota archaeon]